MQTIGDFLQLLSEKKKETQEALSTRKTREQRGKSDENESRILKKTKPAVILDQQAESWRASVVGIRWVAALFCHFRASIGLRSTPNPSAYICARRSCEGACP